MFDLSWGELLLVGAIALVVIGPRELPRVLRMVGQTLAKMRRMASEFQSQFNAAMREAELDELRQKMHNVQKDVRETASRTMGIDVGTVFDPLRTARDELRDAIEKRGANESPAPTSFSTDPALDIPLGQKAEISLAAVSPIPAFDRAAPHVELEHNLASDHPPLMLEQPIMHQKTSRRNANRVIIAAPRDVVKPLARPSLGAGRLYKKTKFSAFPARNCRALQTRPARDEEGSA